MMKIYRVIAMLVFITAIVAFSGCRYRVYFYEEEILLPGEPAVQMELEEPVVLPTYEIPLTPPNSLPTEYDQTTEEFEEFEVEELDVEEFIEEITEEFIQEMPEQLDSVPQEIPPPVQFDVALPEISYVPAGFVQLTYVEAATHELSPQVMEVVSDDALQYGSEESDLYGAEVGVENLSYGVDNTVTVEEAADTDGQAAIGAEGGVVGIVAVYSTLLRQGVNTIFPCQLLYIYVETAVDYVTVFRGSPIYQLVIDAGGLNVSSRIAADRLEVTADWVVRRNPDIIVKLVDEAVLGSEVTNTYAAAGVRLAMEARQGWDGIEAVRNNSIVLLSEQVLETEESRLAAKLVIAYLMYPELFADIDVNAVVLELLRGMGGVHIFWGI